MVTTGGTARARTGPAPIGLSLYELARSMRCSEGGAGELLDELVGAGLAVESSPGCYRLSRRAEGLYGEALRLLGALDERGGP